MHYLMFSYKWSSRDLRKIITEILKSWVADNVKKINYVHDFLLKDGKVEKWEEKIILVWVEEEEALLDFLCKRFTQLERFEIR